MEKVYQLIRAKGVPVHCIKTDTSVEVAARMFLEKEVSSLLVCDDNQVVGIFTKNDLVRRCLGPTTDFCNLAAAEGMTTDLFTTTTDADLEEVFSEMVRRGFRHVPVLDGDQPVGMITPIDILVHQKSKLLFENEELMRYIRGSY